MNTTTKARTRILSLALALCLALGMTLYLPGPVEVAAADVDIGTADDMTDGSNLSGTQVYFGSYNNSPINWYVVETDSNTAVLWTTTNMGNRAYDSSNDHKSWKDSEICLWLNGTSSGEFLESFHPMELFVIEDYGTNETGDYATIDIDQQIVLPSVEEIGTGGTTGTWGIPCTNSIDDKRGFGDTWWLRSPGLYAYGAALVGADGDVDPVGDPVGLVGVAFGIRPAFRLNLSSVLFTSDAAGGKSVTVGDTLSSVPKAPAGPVKLTVLDSALNFSGVTPDSVDGRTIDFNYSGAQSGKTLSAIVTGSGGAVKYYGQLVASTSNWGTGIEVTVPDDFATGDTLQIFVEDLRGDYETDYAGTPIAIPVQEQTAPNVAGDSGKITGVDDTMEYRKTGDTAWTRVPANDIEITGLMPDTYEVRVAGKVESGTAYLASPTTMVTVGAYAATPTLTMTPVKTTLTVGGEADNQTVATANAQNFTGAVTFSIEGMPLPDGVDIDSGDGRIFVDDADALVRSTTTVTVKADNGTDSDTDTVRITIQAGGGDPGPTSNPSATIDDTSLKVGETATLRISLGQSGGAPMATGANIAVDEDVVSVNRNTLDADWDVTVKAIRAGETDIHITFDGVSGYDATLRVKVTEDGGTTTPPTTPSGGGRSSGRTSGGSSTPDAVTVKTQLPASAFSWDGHRTLTIDHERITPLGLLSVRWDGGADLTRGTDYSVYQGSVIIRFSEDFIATQKDGDHTVKVEFLNHTGETTVTVGDTARSPGQTAANTADQPDNTTHNPNTGGYPDGDYPGTDNPNTGGGRGIWPALLLGSLGGIVLVVRRLKPVA